MSSASMLSRYVRAARLTAPKVAAQTPAIAIEGYWLDEQLYFLVVERFEPSLGRIVAIPTIANCAVGSVDEVVPLDVLQEVLSHHASHPCDASALLTAEFDMPSRHILAVSVAGYHYLVDIRGRCVVQACASFDAPALYSPDGRYACFVKGHDLCLWERNTGVERLLTHDGEAHFCYGQESETNLAALSYRRRRNPVGLWSPDSQWFLTQQIDERSLLEQSLIEHSPDGGGRPRLHQFKCVMPGDALPTATYVAIHIPSGRVVAFKEFPVAIAASSPFFTRRAWFGGEDEVSFVRLDRHCKNAELISLNLLTGTGRVVLRESVDSGYLDLNPTLIGTPNVRTLRSSDEVIWFSERDGWGHLYLYDASTGTLKRQITCGTWLVRDIVHVDERKREVYFLAGGVDPSVDPGRRSLCSAGLDDGNFNVLLATDGDVFVPVNEPAGLGQDRAFRTSGAAAGISPNGRFAVIRASSVDTGNTIEILDLRTQRRRVVAESHLPPNQIPPRRFSATAADGVTRVHGVMFLPSDFDERRRYPLIDYIYPGPQSAWQPQLFEMVKSMQARALAELGFVTMMLDTRGLPVASRAFHQAGYGELLEPQLADHAAVVRELCDRHEFVDSGRVGIIGQSAGGAAAARALFDYSDLFKVAVAVCGNHDSRFYSASWSDKYRGPVDCGDWSRQSNCHVAHQLKGALFLISGEMDENVHVSHTLALADALIRANKDFDLLIVPNEGHSVLVTNGYVQRRVWDYFVRHLLHEMPPPDFALEFTPHEVQRFLERSWQEARQ